MNKQDSVMLDASNLRLKWAAEDVELAMQKLAKTLSEVEPTGDVLRISADLTDYVGKLNTYMKFWETAQND